MTSKAMNLLLAAAVIGAMPGSGYVSQCADYSCKNCALRECEGRDGMIVCDVDGESHHPEYFCFKYEREQGR